MQQNVPIRASDHMIPVGVDEVAARKEPTAQPKKPIIRVRWLVKRSANNPQGREKIPKATYMGNPSARTSLRLIPSDNVNGMASAGKAIS